MFKQKFVCHSKAIDRNSTRTTILNSRQGPSSLTVIGGYTFELGKEYDISVVEHVEPTTGPNGGNYPEQKY